MTADQPQGVDDSRQQDVEPPRLVDPGDARVVKVNVSKRGTVAEARISRPSRRCHGVPGSSNRP